MFSSEALVDVHRRCHRSLKQLIEHCSQFSEAEFHREFDGFGYPTLQLQLHHIIGAEAYWLGVLEGRMDTDFPENQYSTVELIEKFRSEVFLRSENYLMGASSEELSNPRGMTTWGGKEKTMVPGQVVMRTQTHIFSHLGQALAICRLMGKRLAGSDYPID